MITAAVVQRDISGGGGEMTLKMVLENGDPFVEVLIDPINRTAKNQGFGAVFKAVPV